MAAKHPAPRAFAKTTPAKHREIAWAVVLRSAMGYGAACRNRRIPAETWKHAGSRDDRPRRNHESARPVCATVTPMRQSFRHAIARKSYLMAASYRSAT
jgi:hypothetical protein